MRSSCCLAALILLSTACTPSLPPPVQLTAAPGEPAAFAGMLAAHNRWRAAVGTPPLGWSPSAASHAQAWADELATRNCEISHSPASDRSLIWGENVYGYRRGGDYQGFRRSATDVVDLWASEQAWYDPGTHACAAPAGEVCGHYTQVVSTYSSHVGCGRARCKAAEVWVCNYSPPGNYDDAPPFQAEDPIDGIRDSPLHGGGAGRTRAALSKWRSSPGAGVPAPSDR
ncbi:CAP domain-containing protein [Panacagrimonas sp.]|uniref:CAP domain-containing protein n=1 Tax=Panacagrimonas sp. TaxID=2480088 RepID=UPI003B51D729